MEDNKKATAWNPKHRDRDCDGITQFLSNYFYPVLIGGGGENKQNNTTTQLSYFDVAWKGHFIINLESRYLLLTAKKNYQTNTLNWRTHAVTIKCTVFSLRSGRLKG